MYVCICALGPKYLMYGCLDLLALVLIQTTGLLSGAHGAVAEGSDRMSLWNWGCKLFKFRTINESPQTLGLQLAQSRSHLYMS